MILRLLRPVVAGIGLLSSLAAVAQLAPVGDGGSGPVKAMHLTAELVTLGSQIGPGGQLQAGLRLTMEDGWHVYWENPGAAGGPPHITWTMPSGVTAGPILFPIPTRLPLGPLTNFGYEHDVTYPILLKADTSAKPGTVHLDAKVGWLVCSSATCIPGNAHLGLDLKVLSGSTTAPTLTGPIAESLGRMPKPLPADAKVTATVGAKDFVVTLHDGKNEAHAEFYPFDNDVLCYAPNQASSALADGARIWDQRAQDKFDCSDPTGKTTPAPKSIHGLIKLSDAVAYEFTAPVVAGEFPRPASSSQNTAPVAGAQSVKQPVAATSGDLTALGAIGLAFLGGLILNLMPCVFPVLFLKALALVNSSSEERGRLRKHGLIYALGILVSFWLVVGLLLVLRASGSKLGWGYQLQSPTFVAVLAAFLFFFALSLAGQFDLGLSLTSTGGELAQKQGYTGSFFTGVLATVVATPCTAPLMGAAIGFALLQPFWLTFVIFTALALGLALPYVLLTLQPGWVSLLPKPGPWMEVLKQFTSLILFATAIGLAWVYGSLASDNAANRIALLLACFLLLAVAGWALGRWPAKRSSTVAAALIIIAALAIPLWPQKAATVTWQHYSEETLSAARAAGKPVFIDFTAAWCLSCQVNEHLVLTTSDVEHALTDGNVTLLKADWTNYSDKITAQLASVGRSGVPTYVIYPTGSQSKPDVLPELLTKSIVLDAIQRDTHK